MVNRPNTPNTQRFITNKLGTIGPVLFSTCLLIACGGGASDQGSANNKPQDTNTSPQQSYTLTVNRTGSGLVSTNVSGIECGDTCESSFDANTEITLTASTLSGYTFVGWTGACFGSSETCTLTINQDLDVNAVFVEQVQTPSILIENYRAASEPFRLTNINANASGITWHSDLSQYLVVKNRAAKIYRYDQQFNYLGVINITKDVDIDDDTEGLTYAGGEQVFVVTEANYAHRFLINNDVETLSGQYQQVPSFRLLPTPADSNKGLEATAYRPAIDDMPARIYACQEGTNDSETNKPVEMRVVYFEVPTEITTGLLSYDSTLTVHEPFIALSTLGDDIEDCAGMAYDPRTDNLIIVSEQSSKAIQVDVNTGEIFSRLSLQGAPQYEGVTLGPNNELILVSEPDLIHVFTL